MVNRRDFCLSAVSSLLVVGAQTPARAKENIVGIDCHAHVFTRELKLAPAIRYAPSYDASIADYLAMLEADGMSQGVLIQPSFLGTDNSYLLLALATAPNRLRGVVVVDPTISIEDLRALDGKGAVGIRLNLIGKPDPDLASALWSTHISRLADLGWQVEIQAEAKRWQSLLPKLIDAGATVVIDHFGLPDKELGVDDPGFKQLLSFGRSRKVWVKLSAQYRSGPKGETIAAAAYPLLRDAFGLDRLVWGSDWPHTQFESVMNPAKARKAFDDLVTNEAERRVILTDSPAQLFRFVA